MSLHWLKTEDLYSTEWILIPGKLYCSYGLWFIVQCAVINIPHLATTSITKYTYFLGDSNQNQILFSIPSYAVFYPNCLSAEMGAPFFLFPR